MGSWVAQAVDDDLTNHVLMFGVDGDLGMTPSMPFPMGEFSHRLDLVASGKIETYSRTVEDVNSGRFEASNPAMSFVPVLPRQPLSGSPFAMRVACSNRLSIALLHFRQGRSISRSTRTC